MNIVSSINKNSKPIQWGIGLGGLIVGAILSGIVQSPLLVLLLIAPLLAIIPAYFAAQKSRVFIFWWLFAWILYPIALAASLLVKNKSDKHHHRSALWQVVISVILIQMIVLTASIAIVSGGGNAILIAPFIVAALSISIRFFAKDSDISNILNMISSVNIKFLVGLGLVVILGLSIVGIPIAAVVGIVVFVTYAAKNIQILLLLWKAGTERQSDTGIEEAQEATL